MANASVSILACYMTLALGPCPYMSFELVNDLWVVVVDKPKAGAKRFQGIKRNLELYGFDFLKEGGGRHLAAFFPGADCDPTTLPRVRGPAAKKAAKALAAASRRTAPAEAQTQPAPHQDASTASSMEVELQLSPLSASLAEADIQPEAMATAAAAVTGAADSAISESESCPLLCTVSQEFGAALPGAESPEMELDAVQEQLVACSWLLAEAAPAQPLAAAAEPLVPTAAPNSGSDDDDMLAFLRSLPPGAGVEELGLSLFDTDALANDPIITL